MKAVVFDMDGVLFDTEAISVKSWCEVAKEQGIKDIEQVVMQCIGRNNTDCKILLLDFYGQDFAYDSFKDKVWDWFQDYLKREGIPMKKGTCELLDYLQNAGYKIGLASSSQRKNVLRNLEKTGLSSYFSAVVTGEMVEHSKPLPDIYLMAREKLGVNPAEAYAIEDSPNGIKSAAAAGMKAIMVPDLIEADEEMERLCFRIFEDLPAVQEFLSGEKEAVESAGQER